VKAPKTPKTPKTPKEKKPPKSPKSLKSPTEPTRKSGRAKNTPTKTDPDSVPEDVVLEGNLKRSESHLFETIADQPQLKKRKYNSSTSSLLYDSHASVPAKRSPGRPSRASTPQNPRAKKGDDDFVFSIEDDEEDDDEK
jgi:chromodomain-helicase-DNA-binding protein 7